MTTAPTLTTSRLHLVPFCEEDVEPLLAVFRSPHVRAYLLDNQLVDVDWVIQEVTASQERFAAGSAGMWSARAAPNPAVSGFVGFRPFFEPPRLQLLYGLLPEQSGQGLATEMAAAAIDHAFTHHDWPQIEAAVDEPNTASIRVLQRLGFVQTGHIDGPRWPNLCFVLHRRLPSGASDP